PAIGQHGGIHRPGRGAGDGLDAEKRLLKQAVEDAPGKGAMRSPALQGKIYKQGAIVMLADGHTGRRETYHLHFGRSTSRGACGDNVDAASVVASAGAQRPSCAEAACLSLAWQNAPAHACHRPNPPGAQNSDPPEILSGGGS